MTDILVVLATEHILRIVPISCSENPQMKKRKENQPFPKAKLYGNLIVTEVQQQSCSKATAQPTLDYQRFEAVTVRQFVFNH